MIRRMNIVSSLARSREVFLLFLIPGGGGIPAGVVLAKNRGIEWPIMLALYFGSDVVLACLFEPLMKLFGYAGGKFPAFGRYQEAVSTTLRKTTSKFGVNPGPFTLILIAFGVDPMTGRAAALFAGHGFVLGWTFAIIGDLLFFSAIMASTLWLNNILGDGTWTAVIIMIAMIAVPSLIRRIRARFAH